MSAMERTIYRRSLGSNAWAFDAPGTDRQHAPSTSGSSTVDFSSDDCTWRRSLRGTWEVAFVPIRDIGRMA
jgi:hypothetical protein